MSRAGKILSRWGLSPIIALFSLSVSAQQAPTPADQAAAARANAEQDRQARQQRDAQQRDAEMRAPSVRSEVPRAATYPPLPVEQPCFRIDRFALDVPDSLPDVAKSAGASALPMDRFAFAREWLAHYAGQCVGKQGIDTAPTRAAFPACASASRIAASVFSYCPSPKRV